MWSPVSAAIAPFVMRRRTFDRNWGDRDAMSVIYKNAVVPRATYEVGMWGDDIYKKRKVIARRQTCQRYAFIAICAGARTVSHTASQVLVGEPPLDMLASELKYLERFRNGSRHWSDDVRLPTEYSAAFGVQNPI